MPERPIKSLRSQRWYAGSDMRGFAHRQRTQQMGLRREEFMAKPVIAILNTWSELSPCHIHLRQRAEAVKRGIWQAGGYPVELPVHSVGEVMVKPSTMLYRNLLAMEAEEALRSNPVDGAVLLGGCDKSTPGLLMGAISMDLPALFCPAGPMSNGQWHGQKTGAGTHTKKYWDELRAGGITQDDWVDLESRMTRSNGTCNTMGTASTMTSIVDAMGLTLPGASSIPAADSAHPRMASACGERIVAMADRFGRQPPLPEWLYGGAIIGLKDGERSFERLQRIEAAGAKVSALWCEDWAGVRQTSFGTRLFWDWRINEDRYPGLPGRIAALRQRGIRFLGYVNPYLCVDGTLFPQAEAAGFLATTATGATALVDFGEFECAVVDFTNPGAAAWFAERVIGQNMLDAGLSGWMADFGEYLPIDVHLANGVDATLLHNAWPVLWAEVNARAVASRGQTGEALFFMRAGYSGVQRHCPLLWGGDQCVDFSRHDGLVSVIPAALSAGLLGNAFHHSDIGGYTSLFGLVRTPELLMRWSEMAAFSPVMRTHEGNRPRDNLQIDGDPAVLAHFARMTRVWVHLVPYLRSLVAEAGASGLPVQRPLFLHFEADARSATVQDAYLYGPDLLVAPVHEAGAAVWATYLPAGTAWVHLWSGVSYPGGERAQVAAPLGQPPVFFRADTVHRALFEGVRAL